VTAAPCARLKNAAEARGERGKAYMYRNKTLLGRGARLPRRRRQRLSLAALLGGGMLAGVTRKRRERMEGHRPLGDMTRRA